MIEIIPNWHPMFVHFTVALISISVILFIVSYLGRKINFISKVFIAELEITGRWCLWIGALITIGTVIAGFIAYNTVKHDDISHLAMHNHRNWALMTATALFILALWSLWIYFKHKKPTLTFIIGSIIVQGLLLSTAWRGGELVYRHGLGVISLPQPDELHLHHHHHHHHQEEAD